MNKKLLGGLACGCLLALAVGVAGAQETRNSVRGRPNTTLLNDVEEGRALQSPTPSADRWIGIAVGPVPDTLRAHVPLPAGTGIMVEQIIPDGPAAKAGLHGASKSLSKEVASRGITVNVIAPGIIQSPATEAHFSDTDVNNLIPMKRRGTPQEIANVVVFLASEKASYISGQILNVNGGMY